MQAHLFGHDDHEKKAADQQPKRQLGDVEDSFQIENRRRHNSGGQNPRHDRESRDFREQKYHADGAHEMVVCADGMFADAESHHQECDHLGDDHRGKYLEAKGFFKVSFVCEYLCHKPQA